jgi:hypothetical protein
MGDSSRKHIPSAGAERPKPRLSGFQAAREVLSSHLQALPEPSAGPPPRLGRRGRVVSYSIAALLLVGVCVAAALGQHVGSSPAPAAGSPQPLLSASVPISSPSAVSAGTLQDPQAAAFLAAYFSWDARDTDSTYAQRWQPYVAPSALPALVSSEPLFTLDNGNDVAAKSPMPTLLPPATQQETGAAFVVAWTIQVLPEGGEGAAWQPRHVQAALSLMEAANGTWLVNAVVWSSQEEAH